MLSTLERRRRWVQVAITVGSTGVALGITFLLGLRSRPFLFPTVAVLVSTMSGGLWAGIASGAITILVVDYTIIAPVGSLKSSLPDVFQFAVFGVVALTISFLTSRRRVAEELLREQTRVLESMVAERDALLAREHKARAEAEAADRLKTEFLATLSHELRTPLNAVVGWSQILTQRPMDAEGQQRALDVIHRNSLAQARLVEEVLDLSRIIAGQMRVTRAPVDLSEVVRFATESMLPSSTEKRLRLDVDAAGPVVVMGDVDRLRQVASNLLSNAIKFTPQEGAIRVAVSASGDEGVLSVTDTGIGIEAEFLPYVFDAFRQQDGSTTRSHGGLGIGLALAQHLVKAHGGTIRARSAGIGLGATIEVRLPLAESPALAAVATPSRDTIG